MNRIYLVRHGETTLNARGLIQGAVADGPLTEKGTAQVLQLKGWFERNNIRFDHVYSSPMNRAIMTASVISDIEPVIMDGLIEMDFGPLEGEPLLGPNPYEITQYEKGGAEDRRIVAERTYQAMLQIGRKGGTSLAISHGVSCGVLELLLNNDIDNNICPLKPNSTVYIYECDGEKLQLIETVVDTAKH